MKKVECDIAIIGAGLAGLTLAYLLKDRGLSVRIIEARERLGGRICTLRKENLAPQEMGATWLGKKHTALCELLEELGLGIFEQRLGETAIYESISTSPPQLVQLPPNDAPSYRIQQGSSSLINTLAKQLASTCQIHTEQSVKSIEEQGNSVLVTTPNYVFRASTVVSTLPPYLLLNSITISPGLPTETQDVMRLTHTWMGDSIKISFAYKNPFWRAKNLSGTIFSNVGPIPEMYDHADYEDQRFALKGFLNGVYFSITKDERRELALQQLRKYYGQQADEYIAYEEKVWRNDGFTFLPYKSHVMPHQNNGHPIFQQSYFDGKLLIAGTETAAQYPGYMEGAVGSAQHIAQQLEELLEVRK
ncbi:MAG: NAD(P)/FAD-dependent oxidoreductase [Bacteroidota bacterium]